MDIFFLGLVIGFIAVFIYTEIFAMIRLRRINNISEIRYKMNRYYFNNYVKLPQVNEMLKIKHIFKTDVESWLKYTANK